jgi:hypothetical protein
MADLVHKPKIQNPKPQTLDSKPETLYEQVSAMADLVPIICGVLTQTLNEKDEESSRQVLEEFINI